MKGVILQYKLFPKKTLRNKYDDISGQLLETKVEVDFTLMELFQESSRFRKRICDRMEHVIYENIKLLNPGLNLNNYQLNNMNKSVGYLKNLFYRGNGI